MSTLRRKVGQGGKDATTAHLKANGVGNLTGYVHISHGEIEIPAGQDQLAVFVVRKRHTFPLHYLPRSCGHTLRANRPTPQTGNKSRQSITRERLHLAIRPDCSRRQIC